MERKYYEINEALARRAHDMMSFSSYREGSKTAEYREYVDRAYEKAEKAAAVRPEAAEKIFALVDRYARKLAENMNQDSTIGTRCPSVMIAGPANFPVKKKEKQVAAWNRNREEWNEIQNMLGRIESIVRGKDIIKSGEADAAERLEKKLEDLKRKQEEMREANKAVRMKDKEKGDAKLREMGYDEAGIRNLREPDFCGRIGYPSYMLQNNNANIHRIEARIRELASAKEAGQKEVETKLFKIVENTEIMRLQILFPGKPEADVREVLKSNGFRWAPSQGAWQRTLNTNARYALDRVKKELLGKEV